MRWNISKFVWVTIIIPSGLGIILANIFDSACVFFGDVLIRYTSCGFVNFLFFSAITALILDTIVYYLLPKFIKQNLENKIEKEGKFSQQQLKNDITSKVLSFRKSFGKIRFTQYAEDQFDMYRQAEKVFDGIRELSYETDTILKRTKLSELLKQLELRFNDFGHQMDIYSKLTQEAEAYVRSINIPMSVIKYDELKNKAQVLENTGKEIFLLTDKIIKLCKNK